MMRHVRWFALAALLSAVPAFAEEPPPPTPAPTPTPAPERAASRPVDLVIALDTSGSMQGLIDAARQKLWSVVSEIATAKPTPRLRVALLTYGSPGNDDMGHVVLQTDFTEDLDLVSERLFALGTNGGEEYVGRVVSVALDRLSWSPIAPAGAADGLRVIFVAGNESADQDAVKPFRDVVRRAAGRKIVVDAVYCGGADDSDAAGWREVAALGGGRFAAIDHDHGTVALVTPFDADLAKLSTDLNGTYLAYGRLAEEKRERQALQDSNAEGAGAPAAAERAAAKAGGLYRNADWDLVDRLEEKDFDLAKIPEADLPEAMRPMTLEQRKAHLEAKKAERLRIQEQVRDLAGKRQQWLTAEMEKQRLDDGKALDRVLRDAIREQAAAAGFEFPK